MTRPRSSATARCSTRPSLDGYDAGVALARRLATATPGASADAAERVGAGRDRFVEVVATRDDFRKATASARSVGSASSAGGRLGLVPTMGALHEGHLSLFAYSGRELRRGRGEHLREPASVRLRGRPGAVPVRPRARPLAGRGGGRRDRVRAVRRRDVPGRASGDGGRPRAARRASRGRLSSRAFRRRRDRRHQAALARRALPCLLRREGLPAAGDRATGWPTTSTSTPRSSAARPCASPTVSHVRVATGASGRRTGARRRCFSRRSGQVVRALRSRRHRPDRGRDGDGRRGCGRAACAVGLCSSRGSRSPSRPRRRSPASFGSSSPPTSGRSG